MDNFPEFTEIAFKIADDVCRYRDYLGHIDHYIIRKLGYNKPEIPRYFLSYGGCRHPNQLNNYETLKDVMNYLISVNTQGFPKNEDYTIFIRYLKETEAQIPKDLYE